MAKTQIETSLLTEHLRYTPITIIDDILNTVNLLVNRAVDAVESGLLSADPETLGFAAKAAAENSIPETDEDGRQIYPEMRAEVEEGVHKLETLLSTNVDRNFDKFEIFALRNIFAVDEDLVPWIRLGHYQDIHLPTSVSSNPSVTPESLRLLRRKLQETRKLHSALAAEKARNDALLSQLRSLITSPTTKTEPQSSPSVKTPSDSSNKTLPESALSFLTSTPSARNLGMSPISASANLSASTSQQHKPAPLSTNTSFTLSQLPSLRALLAELRPKIATLPATDAGASQSRFTKERSEYVEAQTLRILEHEGVDLNELGEQHDGVTGSSIGGRRIGREEVEALERIVGALNGERRRNEQGRGSGADEDAMEE